MKNILTLIICYLILSCSNTDSNKLSDSPLYRKWGTDKRVVLENGKIHTNKHFDQVNQKMVGDSLIPIIVNDSSIIVTEIIGNLKSEIINGKQEYVIESDTCITDTLFYEVRNFNGPKLLLYSQNLFKKGLYYPFILNQLDDDKNRVQEIIFVDNKRFEIFGLSIGDTISRDELEIKDVSNYDDYSVERAELKSNKDIDLEIIGDKYIYGITQRDIYEFDLDDVKKVVNAKLGIESKHIPTAIDNDYESEYYRWSKNGVEISLQRYVYIGDEPIKKIASSNGWNLYYNDNIIKSLLINEFKYSVPKSMIIK